MATSGPQGRTLATVVFTDAVGFSARMGHDEAATIALIDRDLKLIASKCEAHGGRVLKNTGDGLLMCFSSGGDALACALEVQEAFGKALASLGPDHCLQHRIGIHIGDVHFTGNDVLGDGVNIAARLLAEAQPGAICLSQTVYDIVKNRLRIPATYLGPRQLKNIREPVPAYQIITPANSPRPASASPPRAGVRRNAVLAVAVLLVAAVSAVALRGRSGNPTPRQTTLTTQPSPPPSVPPATESDELNRRAAQWILQMGGTMRVKADVTKVLQIDKDARLPDQPFRITYINLVDRPALTDAGLENLAGLTHVDELHLYDNRERVTSLNFARSMTNLRILNADVTSIRDEHLAILRNFPRLEFLKLSGEQITEAGLRHLADLPQLQDLVIHQTQATDAVIAQLAKLPKLHSLDIASTDITNSALERLANHPTLRTLNVSGNKKIDGKCLASLGTIPKLEELRLSRTQIAGPDLTAFARGFPSLTKLELVSLALTDSALDSLVASPNFKNWRELIIQDNKVTAAGIATLNRSNPTLKVTH